MFKNKKIIFFLSMIMMVNYICFAGQCMVGESDSDMFPSEPFDWETIIHRSMNAGMVISMGINTMMSIGGTKAGINYKVESGGNQQQYAHELAAGGPEVGELRLTLGEKVHTVALGQNDVFYTGQQNEDRVVWIYCSLE